MQMHRMRWTLMYVPLGATAKEKAMRGLFGVR